MQPDSRSREGWTRREFVRGAAGLVALPYLPVQSPKFAYVASGEGAVHVFLVRGDHWTKIQRVASPAPAWVLLAPSEQTLYVANEIETHEGLPRGTVEAFRIDPLDGRLTLLNRRPLSLSATRPRHMALSPDGKLLAVAAYGGGIYNVFSVAKDESLGLPGIFKDAGSGGDPQLQDAAHPHSVLFDSSGHLLASDFGNDRLSIFAVEDGRLRRLAQRPTGSGSGPSATVLHPGGSLVYTWYQLQSTLASYRYDAASGTVGGPAQTVSLPQSSAGALAMHSSGRMLYTSQGVWQIDGGNGRLMRTPYELPNATQISAAADGESIYILDGSRGSIYHLSTDRATGELHSKTRVALVSEPKSIAIRTRSG
jgi:6-phosphogluconolactonase